MARRDTLRTEYSHAVPFIREQLVRAIVEAKTARLKRDQHGAYQRALGLAMALRMLSESDDARALLKVPGIAWLEHQSSGAENMAREWLGSDADLLLGTHEEVLGAGRVNVQDPEAKS